MTVVHLFILFCVGSLGLWMAIPVGLAYGFNPYVIAVTIILGASNSTWCMFPGTGFGVMYRANVENGIWAGRRPGCTFT